MWAAIKTDLTDLLTSASADGELVLNSLEEKIHSLDEKLNQGGEVDQNTVSIDANDCLYFDDYEETPEEAVLRLSALEETFSVPLILSAVDCSDSKEESYDATASDDCCYESEDDEDWFEQRQVKQFLESFSIESHADEISQLLYPLVPIIVPVENESQQHQHIETHEGEPAAATTIPNTNLTPLQIQYRKLVPKHISHEEFWIRYYFRCNPNLISERKQYNRLLSERQRKLHIGAINEAALQIGKSAASLLKNVSSAVGESLSEATKELRLNQSSGRPPFVLAEMEDDYDEYIEGEEEISEEEEASLRWESDSEEEVSIVDGDNSIHDEVAFVEGVANQRASLKLESLDVVKLRRTLMHTENERNNMLQMVEERNEEIARLKFILEQESLSESDSVDESLDKLQKEARCLNTGVALKSAQTTICELKAKTDVVKKANALSSLESLINNEYIKQEDLQVELDEYKNKIEQLQRQKQEAEDRISQLLQK